MGSSELASIVGDKLKITLTPSHSQGRLDLRRQDRGADRDTDTDRDRGQSGGVRGRERGRKAHKHAHREGHARVHLPAIHTHTRAHSSHSNSSRSAPSSLPDMPDGGVAGSMTVPGHIDEAHSAEVTKLARTHDHTHIQSNALTCMRISTYLINAYTHTWIYTYIFTYTCIHTQREKFAFMRKIRSCLAVPVKDSKGKTVAVLEAINKPALPGGKRGGGRRRKGTGREEGGAEAEAEAEAGGASFTARDLTLLSSVAATAGNVLRQAQLYTEAVRRRKQTETLLTITDLLSADIGTSMVVPRIIQAAYTLVNAERISMFIIEDRKEAAGDSQLARADTDANRDDSGDQDGDGDVVAAGASQALIALSACEGEAEAAPLPTFTASPHPGTSHKHKLHGMMQASAQEHDKELVCIVSKDKQMLGMKLQWGAGIVGHVAMTLKSLNITDAYSDSRFDKRADRNTNFVTKSILTVPVVNGSGKGVAVIQAVNKRTHGDGDSGRASEREGQNTTQAFDADDVSLIESLAVSAGITMQKSKNYYAIQTAERKNHALMELLRIDMEASLHQVLEDIYKVAYQALSADKITIYFVDYTTHEMFSIKSQDVKGWRFPVGQGIAGYVGETGQYVNVPVAHDDDRFDRSFDRKSGYYTKSILCMPVCDEHGTVLAVVQALNKQVPQVTSSQSYTMSDILRLDTHGARRMSLGTSALFAFNDDDESILSAICRQISHVIRRCQTDALLEEQATVVDRKVRSLIDLYSSKGSKGGTPRRSSASTSVASAPSSPDTSHSPSSVRLSSKGSVQTYACSPLPREFDWPETPLPSILSSIGPGDSTRSLSVMDALKTRDFDCFEYTGRYTFKEWMCNGQELQTLRVHTACMWLCACAIHTLVHLRNAYM